jgi:hypothetical protein
VQDLGFHENRSTPLKGLLVMLTAFPFKAEINRLEIKTETEDRIREEAAVNLTLL